VRALGVEDADLQRCAIAGGLDEHGEVMADDLIEP
jgi:hypothetical protein